MKNRKISILLGTAGVVIAVAAMVAFTSGKKDVQVQTTTVENGTVEITVMATGYIQPVEEVEVGTQVSGVIEKIYVDYNSHVTKGQLLAELDKMTLQEKMNQARASLASAQSEQSLARQSYERVKMLHEKKAATDVALEEAENRLVQSGTNVQTAEANLSQAQVNLSYASIYSPIDGVVLDRSVNTGQTVAASFNTPTLFTIAEDLTKMQVEADVDEADIGMVKVGQSVIFTVDAYSDEVFRGTVSQIRLKPTVTSNVVTYTVIVDAPNPDEKLYPGMTASITIAIESEAGLLVPLEAVNFHMSEEVAGRLGVKGELPLRNHSKTHGVWVLKNGIAEQRKIETGINDGINYVVKSGLSSGEELLLSAALGKKSSAENKPVSIMPGRPH